MNLTLYHVNPLHEGVVPINMDTADIRGDAFFDLRSKVLPIECSNTAANSTQHKSDCTNGEVIDDDLVITMLTLHVKDENFSEYGRCNICGDNGTDPFSHLPCDPGEYICSCGNYGHPRNCNDDPGVGAENITEAFGHFGGCSWDTWIRAPWSCWGFSVVDKTGGMWYSTTRAGWCDAPDADPDTCTWRATIEKVVNKTCSDKKIYDAVEAYDKAGDGCFDRCPDKQKHPHAPRNTSGTCWIYCFYATVLGPSALIPGGATLPLTTGMPIEQIDAAFAKPFAPVAEGGCPALTPPPPTVPSSRIERRRRRPTWRERAAIEAGMYREATKHELEN